MSTQFDTPALSATTSPSCSLVFYAVLVGLVMKGVALMSFYLIYCWDDAALTTNRHLGPLRWGRGVGVWELAGRVEIVGDVVMFPSGPESKQMTSTDKQN